MKYPITEETAKTVPVKKGVKDFLASIGNKKPPEEKIVETPKFPIPNNPLLAVISFLESLTYSYDDGRILITKSPEKQNCKLQFLLLNPTSNFSEIVEEARSVSYVYINRLNQLISIFFLLVFIIYYFIIFYERLRPSNRESSSSVLCNFINLMHGYTVA